MQSSSSTLPYKDAPAAPGRGIENAWHATGPGDTGTGPKTHQQLHFGRNFGGLPEMIICVGLFSLESYRYHDVSRTYNRLHDTDYWHLSLADCTNREDAAHVILPGGLTLTDYLDRGYRNLGYVQALGEQPELLQYMDNPGLLALLMHERAGSSIHNFRNLGRREILRELSGNPDISRRHLNRLARVRAGDHRPATLAPLIKDALLRPSHTGTTTESPETARELEKLINHQSSWSLHGLRYASAMIRAGIHPRSEHFHQLDKYNNGSGAQETRNWLKLILSLDDLPKLFRRRARLYFEQPEALPAEILYRIMHMRRKKTPDPEEDLDVRHLFRFITDADIPEPLLEPDGRVEHLDSFEKMRGHARRQRHCLWTSAYVGRVVDGLADFYCYTGENCRATIAISRNHHGIVELQARGAGFTTMDYMRVLEWQIGAASKRVDVRTLPSPNYMYVRRG